ncbi:hypothetical protein CRYUN_Cryun09bG0140400 [Craigia yunnanensis]
MLGEVEANGILINDTVLVGPYEGDNFTTIGEAITSAPNNLNPEDGFFMIYAREGYYQEYIIVSKEKKNIMLIGDGINKTIVTGNHSKIDGWTTYNSSTFVVTGERFVVVDVTFKNTVGPEKHQAMAVRNNTDFFIFYRCSLEGPSGWLEWNGTFGLDTLYYGEFGNYGPGSNTSKRMKWSGYSLLNATQAMGFTVYNFTMGDTWLHETNIPFSRGLYH